MPPMKLAIIGGGPSAFYVASRLLSLVKADSTNPPLRIHMFDRLWAPHGLVRYGVAPDHPEVKASNCTHKFDTAAADPRLKFFGNVNIGSSSTPSPIPHTLNLSLTSILTNYTHLLFATGCTLPTLHPFLPPSPYCLPALSLVHWYTQHPSAPPPPPLERTTHISLIGNGNVSLDVARMLLTPPSVLEKYDVPRPVLDVLNRSQVRHVSIFGRRGPLEAAFTAKELRELTNLPDAAMVPIREDVLDVKETTRQQGRILQLLRKGSKNMFGMTQKTWSLDFYRSPMGLVLPDEERGMAKLSLAHTKVDQETGRAVPTGETEEVETSLVVTSLGFRSEPSAPFYDSDLEHLRTMPGGRVIDVGDGNKEVKNVYASGWAATGAKGVLAATMMNAYGVADAILSDWLPGYQEVHTAMTPEGAGTDNVNLSQQREVMNPKPDLENVPAEVQDGLKDGVVTQYEDWKKVNEEEIRRGEGCAKERERMGWEEARVFLKRI
ncbi:NADPH:adrenodoxin oxidoreductase, mitochondrial [Termitomyces sp. J132]|nr:NADPH:adrenodoxin oxidoreductase, mitochondrial [Termitomyces sp. J132]